jgi:hypothetical protein
MSALSLRRHSRGLGLSSRRRTIGAAGLTTEWAAMTTLDATDFGIVGDGVTDNSLGLKHLRDTIRQGTGRVWAVEFEPGHYCYADNTWWLFGDRDVVLRFNDARVECISTHAWTRSWSLLPTMNPNEYWADGPFVQAEAVVPAGTRFHSADASEREIELFAAPMLERDEVVLLAGHIQQIREVEGELEGWGWPPNFRVYEYKTVESTDGNVVRFTERLRQAYDETWPEWEHTPLAARTRPYGAPRVFKTRFPGYTLQRSLRVERAVFVGNRNKPYTPLSYTGLHIHLEGCKVEGDCPLHMSHTEHFEAAGCDFARCEIDKINRRVRFDRCVFGGPLTGLGAGVEDLLVRDCDVMGDANGRGIDMAPRGVQFAGTVRVFGRMTFQNAPTVSVPGPVVISGGNLQ